MSKMIGCSKDHGKEIDLYSKPYPEKIARIEALLKEAEKEVEGEDMQRRTYYYAQALLVFYYLIPESDSEDAEVKKLELRAHRGKAQALLALKRYDEAL